MSSERMLLVAAGASVLAGCAQTYSLNAGPIEEAAFGEANRQTMLAQVVDPEPVYAGPMVTSADHAAAAVERYRTDTVKQPERIRATESILSEGGDAGTGTTTGGN